jgi:hypothetical protein
MSYWDDIRERAKTARAAITPGLLGDSVGKRGAGFVGLDIADRADGRPHKQVPFMGGMEAALAAGKSGRVSAVSLGSPQTFAQRTQQLLKKNALVVASLPPGNEGWQVLDTLLKGRKSNQLIIAMRAMPPATVPRILVPVGIAGLSGNGGLLVSRTARNPGLLTGIDLAPTILQWLGSPIPAEMHGLQISRTGKRDTTYLAAMYQRLKVVNILRYKSIRSVLAFALLLGVVLVTVRRRAGYRQWLRAGSLAFLWFPALTFLMGALSFTARKEVVLLGFGACILGLLTDRFIRWPRAPMLPAFVGVGAVVVDLFNHSHLIIRSILGPDPLLGVRLHGLGNELESTVPVLMMVGLAAALSGLKRSRKLAVLFSVPMGILTVIMAAGQLGAAVGAVFTAGIGAAIAVLFCLYARPTRRAVITLCAVPVIGLMLLTAIDLTTGGDAHFTNTVLSVGSPGELFHIFYRRFKLAYHSIFYGYWTEATLISIMFIIVAYRRRATLFSPVAAMPSWSAVFIGLVAAGVAGSFANDSGPQLLVYATVFFAAGTAYVRGDPRLRNAPTVFDRAVEVLTPREAVRATASAK